MKTKHVPLILKYRFIGVFLFLLISCKKDEEKTSIKIPIISTNKVDIITQNKAMVIGEIIDNGGEAVFATGVYWGTNQNPSFNEGIVQMVITDDIFIIRIHDLEPNTTYYVQAYASNSKGKGLGEVLSFTTLEALSDVEGNTYPTVLIGSQEWMAENLRTTKYADGYDIEYPGDDNFAWSNNTDGAYAWFANNITYKDFYGALYNWYAIDNTRGLCPVGWHVPDYEEWIELHNYLLEEFEALLVDYERSNHSIYDVLGNALKSCRQIGSPLGSECNVVDHPRWFPDHLNYGLDLFGFAALPGGGRHQSGGFREHLEIGYIGGWWSSIASIKIQRHWVGADNIISQNKASGWSVRCVRNTDE